MKSLTIKLISIITFLLLSTNQYSNAQFIEDALRFIKPNSMASPRAGALGYSYFGLSDDASALVFNPAGLTLVPNGEIALGLNYNRNTISTDFWGNDRNETKNEFYFSNVQFVFPNISVSSFNARWGFSYYIENDFDLNTRYSGYNTENTFIAQQAAQKRTWTHTTEVADTNYHTNIKNNMQQDGFITEKGGLHNFALGGAVDINENFSIGGTIIAKVGSYDYKRNYYETDINNVHNTFLEDDITSLFVRDRLTQDIAGVSGIIGTQIKFEKVRLGLTVKFPTALYITENFLSKYSVIYDPNPNNGIVDTMFAYYPTNDYGDAIEGTQDYVLITPFEFAFGVSGNIFGLTYSVAASYQNAAETYFNYSFDDYNDPNDIMYWDELNEQLEDELTHQFTLSAGLEYKFSSIPLFLRGSYTLITSPYNSTDIRDNQHIIGAGVGILLTDNFILDATFVYNTHEETRANYGNASNPSLYSSYQATIAPKSFNLGFRYRF